MFQVKVNVIYNGFAAPLLSPVFDSMIAAQQWIDDNKSPRWGQTVVMGF